MEFDSFFGSAERQLTKNFGRTLVGLDKIKQFVLKNSGTDRKIIHSCLDECAAGIYTPLCGVSS